MQPNALPSPRVTILLTDLPQAIVSTASPSCVECGPQGKGENNPNRLFALVL